MRPEKRESVISSGSHAAFALGTIGEQERLEHIYHLRDVAHVQLVRLPVEDVEAQSSGYRAAHRALLPKLSVTFFIFFGDVVPDAPFIEDETNLLTLLIAIEHGPLMNDCLLDLCIGGKLIIHVVDRETC